jgi:hypothetical protein
MKHLVHTGKSTGNGCIVAGKVIFGVIGLAACVSYFVVSDPDDYGIEALFLLVLAGGLLYEFFRPKAKAIEQSLKIDKSFLYLEDEKIPLDTLHLQLYVEGDRFCRYHLWDDNAILAIYSIYKDALIRSLAELGVLTDQFIEKSSSYVESGVSVFGEAKRKLYYSLETGEFWITEPEKDEINVRPKYVIVDPKYVDSEKVEQNK